MRKGDESEETEVKKDIEWAIKEIEGLKTETSENYPHNKMIEKEIVLGILNRLDEPEVNSQIDKLANFIMSEVEGEPSRNQSAVDTAIRIIKSYQNQETLSEYWIEQKSIDTHVDTLSGEVQVTFRLDDLQNLLVPKQEREQKYYVDLDTAAYVAKWNGDGSVQIYTDSVSGSDEYELHLTEQEIKDYDERYFAFAVKVEELEDGRT